MSENERNGDDLSAFCPFNKRAKHHEGENVHSADVTQEDDNNRTIEERLREFQVLDEVDEDVSGSENGDGDGEIDGNFVL